MSFWHTFVGKAIHHVSLGTIGPDSSHAPTPPASGSSSSGVLSETEIKCIGDFDFYIHNPQLCMTAGLTPTNPGHVPTPNDPNFPTTSVPTTPTVTPPVSSVPEPSALALVLCGLVIVAFISRKRRH